MLIYEGLINHLDLGTIARNIIREVLYHVVIRGDQVKVIGTKEESFTEIIFTTTNLCKLKLW